MSNLLNPAIPIDLEPDYKPREDGSKMLALVWQGKTNVKVQEVDVPDVTQPDDAIIQITGSTICGSDLHLYHNEILDLRKGDILGHEFMGKVERVGPNFKKLKIGQRVVVSFQVACGQCKFCKQKLSSMCDRTNNSSLMESMYGARMGGFFGYAHFTGGFPGGQAEYVRVPFGDVNCLPIPDSVPDEKALYLSDILPTSYHAVVDTGVKEGDVVGVWGVGPIGQYVVRWALLKGASRVIAIDKNASRLAFAKDKSGAEIIDVTKEKDVVKKIKEMVPGGGLDVAIDCATFHEPAGLVHKVERALMLETDSAEIINDMIRAVTKMGRVGIIGVYAGFTNHFNIGAVMEKGVRFIGNGQAPVHKYWEEILNDYIIPGKFDPTFILTHRCPIEDMEKAYKKFDERIPGLLKVFVETKFSGPPAPGTPKTTRVDDW